ncbi:hypothetical protein GA0070558_113147 [Micromonospora haikouensis]|uniref:Uncharacterized protein n=1 Tax=Micromonospora haikouensis TaxID=686309 RepID=A0A1C4W6K9_9ACTN|nr:hypothetical protein GA0070558_113147 [Micromonospora haikouensis]
MPENESGPYTRIAPGMKRTMETVRSAASPSFAPKSFARFSNAASRSLACCSLPRAWPSRRKFSFQVMPTFSVNTVGAMAASSS